MMEKGRITAIQMSIIMYPSILATAILSVPSTTAKYAKQDLWISPIWDCAIGLLLVFILLQLHKLYPGENIIQYSEHILGRFIGKLLGIFYLLFFLYNSGIVLREYGEFIVSTVLPKTPIIVILASMTLVSALAIYGGLEVLARAALVFLPVFALPLLLGMVMLLPDMEPQNILPIMGNGILPSLQGAFFLLTWFSDFLYLSFLLPFLKDKGKEWKWSTITVIAVTLTMAITNLTTVFVLGDITQDKLYPVKNIAKYISLVHFFEHVEAISIAVWITGAFIKFSLLYYALVLGTTQVLNVSDYKLFVLPLGFLQVLFSIWVAPSFQEIAHFFSTAGAFYFPFIEVIIPLFLLFVGLIRKKYKSTST
ncbi:GerAB/ArcD/ProY family transporter [Ectobacillus polymachus]|uniref:GerAB/ArcD/ProY family transporter n=1 Tax=Ectobacillus polymachus TaxID=1508806 RepID=UPI003A859938